MSTKRRTDNDHRSNNESWKQKPLAIGLGSNASDIFLKVPIRASRLVQAPLVGPNIANWKMAIEIVRFPIKKW